MQETSSVLHYKWLAFYRQECSERDLAEFIYRHVLSHPARFKLCALDPDARHELLATLYPRIIKGIHRYREGSASFDAYIHSMVKWGILENNKRSERMLIGERIAWQHHWTEEVNENEDRYPGFSRTFASLNAKTGSKRQQLILILKTAPLLGPQTIFALSKAIGMPGNTLMALIEQVNTLSLGSKRRLEYQRKLRENWAQIVMLRGLISRAMIIGRERSSLCARLSSLEHRRQKLMEIEGKNALCIRNREVAQILGISISTVSSSLRFFSKFLSSERKERDPLTSKLV